MRDIDQLIAETFTAHQPVIADFAQSSPENMAKVYRFVLATIQQPLWMTPGIVQDFERQGSKSAFAFGMKGVALDWLAGNYHWVYDVATRTYVGGEADADVTAERLMLYFASLPGLGLIKGGFMAQLCFGLSGCIDRHNCARFGYNERDFAAHRFKALRRDGSRLFMVQEYLEMVRSCGGTAQLWAEWCEYVAARDKRYGDAVTVSALHCVALGLEVKK